MPATKGETATEAGASDEFFKRQADALLEVARGFLAGGSEANSSSADHYQVMVHVDQAALRERASPCGCSDLPIESVRRLLCDTGMIPMVEDHQQWLNAHHVKHWIDGGETSMANTLLLCGRHHRLLHEAWHEV
ncbi:MAG: HNH endonuclease [Pseudomonadales bacterium]|nr:HNH endonuclease [Pseudomonadales bacterium]MDP4766008.1 HNH endonuclease [Pseudomonadales bacterium]MDP5059508.1 HNH endonuclease [Pseudomonadales bacterium]